jgi:AcrR family transcriptional regulator
MDDVADVAGVGRATVYRRFQSRDELVHATIGREINRFFGAVAQAVADLEGVEDKVVEGFLVGMRITNESLVPGLFENDKPTALSLFTSAPVLELGRAALVSQYQAITGETLDGERREEVEWVAEALVRLAVSFVLMPGSVVDFADPDAARRALSRVVRPLLRPPENAPRSRSPQRPARR